MAKILEVTADLDVGLYDRATGNDCVTEKVVDVSEDCPALRDNRKSLFLFTRDSRHRIVQMIETYPGEETLGSRIQFSVDGIDAQLNVAPRDDTFGSWARKLGLSKIGLISLIQEHAPA